VDVTNNQVTSNFVPSLQQTPLAGPSTGVSAIGSVAAMPAVVGSAVGATVNSISSAPRIPLRQLVTPLDENGLPDPKGTYVRPGASTIYREQGKRLIAVKFSVRGRDLAGAVAEAKEKAAGFIQSPYRTEWSGEFQEMEEAEHRLLLVFSLSMVLIVIMLYLAF